jgi:hypothetical protein
VKSPNGVSSDAAESHLDGCWATEREYRLRGPEVVNQQQLAIYATCSTFPCALV